MQFDSMSPIWLQVMKLIEEDIASGKKASGEKLPGGRDLAITYSINPNTAARVYQELEKKGLCETKRGMGTFVTADKGKIQSLRAEMAETAIRQFVQKMALLGFTPQAASEMILKEENEP